MKIIRKIILLIIVVILLYNGNSNAKAATFDDINQSEVFLKQQGKSTCTLSSAAMMMRRAAMLQGNGNWSGITEASLKSSAWVSGAGMKWSFSYAGISVGSAKLPTGSANKNILINLLAQHPEGIVLHYSGAPHAVLLTDYTDGVFYCSDPLPSRAKARIPLSKAYKVTATNATRYWYVTSPACYLTQETRVLEPQGYGISINRTLFSTEQNIEVKIDPYDDNIENYTFVILKNGSVYQTIDNGVSSKLIYNISIAGKYQIYGVLRNAGGTFYGSTDNGGLEFEVSDQILKGFNYSSSGDNDGFDASKGIWLWLYAHDGIEVTDYRFEIYKLNENTSTYEYYSSVDNGTSNEYHFQKSAGKYKLKMILSNEVSSVTDECYLNAVSEDVLDVAISYDKDDWNDFILEKTDKIQLRADITPNTAVNKNVTWKSSNPDVVQIDENGNMTKTGYGFSVISVYTEDGNFEATLPVKINGFGFLYGDISGNGRIDGEDLTYLRGYIYSNQILTDEQKKKIDLDGNGIVDEEDLEFLRQYLYEDRYVFPVESMIHDISIDHLPYKTQYALGETLKLEGLKLAVRYNSGQTVKIEDGYEYYGDTNEVGTQKVVLSYCEDDTVKETEFYISVNMATPTIVPTPSCSTATPTPAGNTATPIPTEDDLTTPTPTSVPTLRPPVYTATPVPTQTLVPDDTSGLNYVTSSNKNTISNVSKNTRSTLKKVGTVILDKKANLKYVIVKKGTITGEKVTGAQIECKTCIKKKNRIVIPDTVTWNGVKYQVVSIAANAFKNNTKVTKISIGQNVKKIGTKAFYGCKKVRQLSIRSKQFTDKKIGKNAFAKMGKGMTVRIPKEKYHFYKKLLKKKGIQ